MSLRMRILLFLALLGLLPLLLAVLINLPLVLERVDLFYRHALLQNLRTDFNDLDQHLASRDGSVRLLGKLPEPGALMGSKAEDDQGQAEIDRARARYTQWINRILGEQVDITQILFIDEQGVGRFWLERDGAAGPLVPTLATPRPVDPVMVQGLLQGAIQDVVLSPLRIDRTTVDKSAFLTMQLLGPVLSPDGKRVAGVVMITLDVAGLAQRDRDTLWVQNNGEYLQLPDLPLREGNAFTEFAGLEHDFAANKIVLWEGSGERWIWVPMFRTDSGLPLWVGRQVNDQPLAQLRSEMVVRVLAIVLMLIVLTALAARLLAKRAERIGSELTGGIQRMLETGEAVTFNWHGFREMQRLGEDLTLLSQTHASHTRNLRAHARELEASNRYKSEFLANVSHELRTPLNSILLLSKLLTDRLRGHDDEAREQAEVIHKAGAELRSLIDNILDLSRIEAGHLAVDPQEVVVSELLEDLRSLIQPQFIDRGLILELSQNDDAPRKIVSDPDRIRQVLKNFLANALKFTAHGRVQLTVRAAALPYAIEFVVIDTGIGIAHDKQAVIFEAFQQADGSTSRRYGGTGLGLTISSQLAALLGGEIRLESELGAGSAFSLLLPRQLSAQDPGEAPILHRVAAPITHPGTDTDSPGDLDLHGYRCLIMDQDVHSQLHLSRLLRGWGAQLQIAGDADEACEALEDLGGVDLLLIAPGMPGLDACATIETLSTVLSAECAVIALLDAAGDAQREECIAAGVDDFVVKPVAAAELAELLQRHLPERPE